jgi:hypothetical protein
MFLISKKVQPPEWRAEGRQGFYKQRWPAV